MAKLVGGRLSDIASQIDPNSVPYHKIERIMFEAFTLAISQTGYHVVPVQVFRRALEMVRGQTRGWTHRSILDMLFYGRKMFTQFLINFEGNDLDELKLINQFVDFFNIHCLPWIRSHGGWVSNSSDELYIINTCLLLHTPLSSMSILVCLSPGYNILSFLYLTSSSYANIL